VPAGEVPPLKTGLVRTGVDWLRYAAVRLVLVLLQILPWSASRHVACFLGDLAFTFDRRGRQADAVRNIRRAFPSLERAQAVQVLKDVYRNLARMLVDSLKFARLAARGRGVEFLETVGFERLQQARGETGVIFVTGHFGHWEVLGTALPLLGYPVWSLGREFRNPFLDSYVRRMRETTEQHMLPKRGAMRQIIRLLKQGSSVGFLIDQDARKDGIFVDFFGRPASTTPAPARIALGTGAPVAFVYARWIPGRMRFRIVLHDLVLPQEGADVRTETLRMTQRLTADLEAIVREAPAEWLWLHRRWKTYPGKYGGT